MDLHPWLRITNLLSWTAYGTGLLASWVQEEGATAALAIAGILGVLVTAAAKGYEVWSEAKRRQRQLDVDAALALDRKAREAGTTLDRLEGHVEQASEERAVLASRLERVEAAVLRLVDSCTGPCGANREAIVACLAPTPDGLPGCHGLGPEHSPLKVKT